MEEDCPSCLAKGIKSSVNFCQITLDSALLACSNLNCSFPFDRQYRDVIWKRDYKDINIERKPKVKLEDVTLKDVKPIDDYFNLLELPDIIPNETIESTNTTAVSSSSPSVDFSTLVALSEEDAHPLVVNDERSPDNPVSESQCINNSNNSYNMDNSPHIMGDLSFLETDSEEAAKMRSSKGSTIEETHSGNESDSDIPVIELESEDEEEKHENWRRAVGDNAFNKNSLSSINENLQREIEGNSSSGRDGSFEVEESLLIDSKDNNAHCENVTGKNSVSVDGVKTYIVICKDVVPTFDVDQLKRNGISVQILNPNSSLIATDNDKPEMSSVKEIIGSDYSSAEHISSEPGRPYNIVEDKVRIWLGDFGSECEMVITPAHLFHYIVQNFVSKPENGEVGSSAMDRKVEVVSPMLSEEIGIISKKLSTVTVNDARNFYADAASQTDSAPSKESPGTVSRDDSEPWSRKASERFSMLKSLTTAVSSNSSTKLIPHSNLLTSSGNSVNDGTALIPYNVAECTEEFYAPYVTKRRRTWKKTDVMKHELVLGDSDATTPDSTKDTSSDKQTLDEFNEGFLKESFSSGSSIRSSKSLIKFGSLVKTSPTVRLARLIKYKANRFRRQVRCSAKSKVAHWRKSVISPDTTLESSDVSSLNKKSVALSEPSTPSERQFELLKTKIAQLADLCTQSPESTHLGSVPKSTLSSFVAEECVTPCSDSCVSDSISTSSNKSPSPTKRIPSIETPSLIRSSCSVRPSYPVKCRIPRLIKSVISSSDTAVTVHSEEELVIRNEESVTPCEAKSSTSPDINSAVKSTSPIIDNSTSGSKCVLLNEQTQPSHTTSTVRLGRSFECEQNQLDHINMTDTIPSHAVSPSTIRSIVEKNCPQRSKRIQLRRSFKSSTKPTSVKSLGKESTDSTYKKVNPEKLLSTSNNIEELSEANASEECVRDLALLAVRGQSPPRSDVPQLKGPVRTSPESPNSVKSDKQSDVQETVPPLTELHATKSVTSPYDSSVKELAPSLSATIAVKQSPRLKSYCPRKSFTPPVKSMKRRKSVESSIKSKVTYSRKARVVHLRKRISKSPDSTFVQPPRATRQSSSTDDLDKSQLFSSTSNVEMKPEHNVTRKSAISDSTSLKLIVHDSALKGSRSVLSATSVQSSRLRRTTGKASRKTVAPPQNIASYRSRKSFTPPVKSMKMRKSVESSIKSKVTYSRKNRVVHLRKRISKSPDSTFVQPPRATRKSSATDDLDKSQLFSSTSNVEMKPEHKVTRSAISDSTSLKHSMHDSALKRSSRSVLSATSVQSSQLRRTTGKVSRRIIAPPQNIASDMQSASASVEQPVRCTRSSSVIMKKSVRHSSHTKPVTSSNTAAKRSSLNRFSASATSNKLKTLRTTGRSTKLSCSSKTSSCAITTRLVEVDSPVKTKEIGMRCRPTRSSVICEETSATRRSNSPIAVSESEKSTVNSTASRVSELCREAAETKPDASPQAASVTEVSRVRKLCRQKHLPQGSLASSHTKTNSLVLSSPRLLESNFKQNLKCSNVSVVIFKSPAATAALLKLRKESARASGIQPMTQSTDCSSEKHLSIHRINPVKAGATPLSRAYVKLHRISVREGFNLRHISKFMKEKDTFKAEGNSRTVFPSKSQKSDSYLQQIVPPGEPSVLELGMKDSVEKENIANSKKRRKYSVEVRSEPKRRSVHNKSSSEENILHISSSVVLKSQSEQLTAKSRVLLTRVSQTSLSNKNLSKQVNSVCTKGVVSREDVNTRRLVKRVAHQSRLISSVKERHNVQPKLDETSSSYSVKGLVSQERRSRRTFNLQQLKGTPVRSSSRRRSCKKC